MTNKYLIKIDSLEKQAIFAEAAGIHLAQNLGTKALLKWKGAANHIANGFAGGMAGVVPTGIKEHAKRILSGTIAPEIATIRQTAHEAGIEMGKHIASSTKVSKRAQVGLRLLSQGNIPKLQHFGLDKHPAVMEAAGVIDKHFGTKMTTAIHDKAKGIEYHQAWKRKDLPLLSNVMSNMSKGKVIGKTIPGKENINHGVLGAAISVNVEPIAGGFNLAKTLMASKAVQNNKFGAWASKKLEHAFITHPAEAGYRHGSAKTITQKAKDWVMEHGVNSVSGSIKKTTGVLKDIDSK